MIKKIIIEVEESLRRKFKVKLAKKGLTAKQILTEYIEKWTKK